MKSTEVQAELGTRNEQNEVSLDGENSFLLVTLKPNGAIEFCKKPQQVSGLSDSEGESFSWMTIFHPQDAERVKDELSVAWKTGEPLEPEARLRRADGEYRWYLMKSCTTRGRGRKYRQVAWNQDRHRGAQAGGGLVHRRESPSQDDMRSGDTHTVILDGLCRLVEEVSDGAIASILLLDPNDHV